MATTEPRKDFAGLIHDPIAALEDAQIRYSKGRMADPLLRGHLPVRRLIPTDFHAALDYGAAATFFASTLFSDSKAACTAASVLGGTVLGVSLLTDYRLSLKKLIPIEVHEGADYLYGFAAIAAPFALGYFRKAPVAAALHVFTGVTALLGSLFTDYRGYRGVKWFKRHPAGRRSVALPL